MKRNGNIIIISLIFMTTVPVGAAGAKDEIFLQNRAGLKAGPICLADIAVVKAEKEKKARLDSLIVAQATAGEAGISVGIFEICRALSLAQIDPASVDIFGASYCQVTIEGAEELKKAAEPAPKTGVRNPGSDSVEKQATLADELIGMLAQMSRFEAGRLKVDWRCSQKGFLELPATEGRFKIVPRSAVTLGNIMFEVVDNHQAKKQTDPGKTSVTGWPPKAVQVRGYVQLSCESVTAVRRLATGTVITAADIKIMPRRVSSYREIGMTDMGLVIGQEAARIIAAQAVIHPEMIRKLQLVQRNQPVQVHSKVGQVQVTLHGVALAAGGLGDEITVRCGSNKTTIRGKITGPGEVTLSSEPVANTKGRSVGLGASDYQKL